MNESSNFKVRPCPCCGSAAATAEATSARQGETLTPDELRPYWRGLFNEKVFFTYNRCSECGLLYAPIFFDDAQLSDLYSEMPPNMDLVSTEAIKATQRAYFEEAMPGLNATGGFLEIGPDVGHIVRSAAVSNRFDHFYLFEPNKAVHAQLADATYDQPHTLSADMTDLSAVPDDSVALGVMIHVLDHLLDPRAMLEQIRKKLKPTGRLVLVTHNERSTLRKVMGSRWPPFCLQHPELYNPQSITRLLKTVGFGSVEVRKTKNYFPLNFMFRQAAYAASLNIDGLPLPKTVFGFRLGNIMTIAHP